LFNILSIFENESPFPKKTKKKLKAKLLSFLTDSQNRSNSAHNCIIFKILQNTSNKTPGGIPQF